MWGRPDGFYKIFLRRVRSLLCAKREPERTAVPAGHESPSGAFKPQTGLRSKCRVFSAARSPLLSRRGRRRVAAPCVCFVPCAALASCRPLPQQLLPVSAAGRSRFGVANKNTISAIYAQSEAESIPNRLSRFNAPSQNPPARLRRSGGAPVSAPASRRIPGGTVPETAPAPAAVCCRSPSKSRTSRW